MNNQLFIANKIKVGFQNRSDTYTNKLAYVIYFDAKGKLRKEKSWEGWRDKKIDPQEFENTPQTGFTFNKGVTRGGGDWFGESVTKIRVWDPRGFEFEISVGNLTQLLMHSDVSKRDIVQPCVYAWSGTELILLPTNSTEYEESMKHTAKQSVKFSAKNLTIGHTYGVKVGDDQVVYLGRFDHYQPTSPAGEKKVRYGSSGGLMSKAKGKKHVFYNTTNQTIMFNEPSSLIASVLDENIDPKYADYLDKYYAMFESQPIKKFYLTGRDEGGYYYNQSWIALSETEFVEVSSKFETKRDRYDYANHRYHYDGFDTDVSVSRFAKFDEAEQALVVSYDPSEYGRRRGENSVVVEGLSKSDPRVQDIVTRMRARYNEVAQRLYDAEMNKVKASSSHYASFYEFDRTIRKEIDKEFNARSSFKAIMADGKKCSNTPSIY